MVDLKQSQLKLTVVMNGEGVERQEKRGNETQGGQEKGSELTGNGSMVC